MAHDGYPDHHHHDHPGVGHNGHAPARQWQTPHRAPGDPKPSEAPSEPDLDLVETAFLDSFPACPDPTSFLRLAGVPFAGKGKDGTTLHLLRVEMEQVTDIGSITPHLGGGHRYDPLPAAMTSRRRRLAFVYFDGGGIVRLSLAAAKALQPVEL